MTASLQLSIFGDSVSIDRRMLLVSTGVAAFGSFAPSLFSPDSASGTPAPFQWQTSDLVFSFDVTAGKLRQGRLRPVGTAMPEVMARVVGDCGVGYIKMDYSVDSLKGLSSTTANIDAKLLYPTNLGIKVTIVDRSWHVEFPRPHMACLVSG